MSVAIVTDSTADIPQHIVDHLNIHVIPAILIVGEKSYLDGEGFTREDFYTQLPDMDESPTTATPSIEAFQSIYKQLFADGNAHIISIHVADALSGITNTARIAASEFGDRIRVIDSEQISMGLGFQAIEAAKAAAANLGLDGILTKVRAVQENVRLFAMLDTLEYIRRSGRVSWAKAQIGSLLRIKPFVEVSHGKVINIGQVRTRKKGFEHLLELIHNIGPFEQLAILHTNAEEEAHKLISEITIPLLESPPIVNVTTVIGNHVGPNALGFVAILKS